MIICAKSTWLFYGAKLQILNDIHNYNLLLLWWVWAVLWCKVTNFEWYTQPAYSWRPVPFAVLWCKVTNFEWYTQLYVRAVRLPLCCFMVQSYKFWMIYTTWLWRRHNCKSCFMVQSYKFWMIYTTDFGRCNGCRCCFMVQSYKFWMIYTTCFLYLLISLLLFYGAKLQILNDIHNWSPPGKPYRPAVLWCKVTNFEWYTQL